MNLIEEIDKFDKESQRDEDWVYDPMLWKKLEIWREMAKRIEALEAEVKDQEGALLGIINPGEY